jgi:hypothetical protein
VCERERERERESFAQDKDRTHDLLVYFHLFPLT